MFEGFSFTSYYVDKNIWGKLETELKEYKNILVVTGEKSYEAVKENLLKVLELKKYSITKYQGECSYEHADEIINFAKDKDFDLVLGVGGGKAIDTAKIVASKLKKDIFVVPTIASTCAGTSALSVVYNNDKTFKEFCLYDAPPKKIFIDLETIKKSPKKYIWAGMGDTLAKFYEVRLKAEYLKNKNIDINFPSSMGVELSKLCRDIIIENGIKAYENPEINEEFKKVVLAIIANTGMVSNLVDEFLNGGIAHSVFYGLTVLPRIEKEHLHGEVVAFGILVQLLMEKRFDEYKELSKFYTHMNFPQKLSDVVILDEFFEKENEIIKEILAGPDLIDFDFDMSGLKDIILNLK